jgi:hypothetical protein
MLITSNIQSRNIEIYSNTTVRFILYGCKTLSLILMVLEKEVLKVMSGPQGEKGKG